MPSTLYLRCIRAGWNIGSQRLWLRFWWTRDRRIAEHLHRNGRRNAQTSTKIVFVGCVKPVLPQTCIMGVNFGVHRRKLWTGKRHL